MVLVIWPRTARQRRPQAVRRRGRRLDLLEVNPANRLGLNAGPRARAPTDTRALERLRS
jgi:hypothetical protein